jgi:ribosome-associated toxin RatA of RatAB toxin-antitoxin module
MGCRRHLAGLVVALWVVPARADDAAALRRGEDLFKLVEVKGSSASRGFVKGVVDAPLIRVFEVITDFDGQQNFMPRVRESRIVARGAASLTYHTCLDLPWPVSDVFYDAEVSWTADRRSIRFAMVPGTGRGVRRFDGHWKLASFEGSSDRTVVQYDLHFEPTTGWPAWVLDAGTQAALEDVLPALRKHLATPGRTSSR